MTERLYFTVSSSTQVSEILSLLKTDPEYELNYSTKVGAILGAVIGLLVGFAQLVYIGSPALNAWPYVAMIPIYSAIGWALFGTIAGCGGIFAALRFSEHPERHFDTRNIDGKIIIAIEMETRRELAALTAKLYAAGVTDLKVA
jgi:hypothetical protein